MNCDPFINKLTPNKRTITVVFMVHEFLACKGEMLHPPWMQPDLGDLSLSGILHMYK